ncbi:MFS transporter [Plastoroseomonas hellenica]|uniref:MFS transporter n=1 Tax=Plastoroseomonas hellenica TaxID=2687306 RepID=UPI001BA52C3C|nr:MFS transporter [Plastoroseomonas hellenica]MBR0645466.1 MFS transporter [Plastoroseomonas hellenica]
MADRSKLCVIAALGTTQTLSWASSYYLPAILARPMAEALGVSTTFVFGAFSAALLLTAFLGPAVGRVIDARGGRDVLVASNLVFAAGLALLGLAQGTETLVAAWMLLGLGMALGLYDSAFATLAGLYGKEARGPITGITLIAGFASTIGWPVTAAIDAGFGWREACFVWAALHLVLGLPVNRLLVPAAPPPATGAAADTGDAAPRRALVLLAFVFAVAGFTASAMGAHLPGLLHAAGASPAAAVAAAALVGFAQVGARVIEFSVLRRLHPLLTARIAVLTHPVGAAALLLFGGTAASVFTLLHGAGNGMLTIARGTLPLALFGAAGYGRRQGLVTAPARVVQAIAPLAFGLLVDAAGPWALLLTSALGILALGGLALIRVSGEASR